jgi:hypothetical protein
MSGSSAPPGAAPSLLLDYTPASDLVNGAISANTWIDIIGNLNFTVTSNTSLVYIHVRGILSFIPNSYANAVTRLVIDGSQNKLLGGGVPASNEYFNLLSGVNTIILSALGSGVHTVKLQMFTTVVGSAYCRPATYPNYEYLSMQIVEHK